MTDADLLVIGSGIAGLSAALRASAGGARVLVVTKGALAEGSTRHAQGGIAGAVGPGDSPVAHVADTLAAGAGLCSADAVQVLCTEGPARIAELIARGVAVDRDPEGEVLLGLEGAHSRPRILHAGGDATGLAIEEALLAAIDAAAIPVREHATLIDLIVSDGRVRGAQVLVGDGAAAVAQVLDLRAGAVLLATGGDGQLFAHTTNPAVATGDGIAAAARAGARLADLEFHQFHPTALAAPGPEPERRFLISEAVRGEGAVLRDEHGRRFMPEVDPRAELAPRDVVAREIAQVMARQGGRPVLLDATRTGPAGIGAGERAAWLARRFPTIDAAVRAAGLDWAREPIPVTPAAHYLMGGVSTDLEGRTSLPGLYAAGECARTGVHGANRLASNSLLEGAVFGPRAADAALADLAPVPSGNPAAASPSAGSGSHPHPGGGSLPPVGGAAVVDRRALQRLMWERVGLMRTGAELAEAARILEAWCAPAPTSRSAAEDRNLLELGRRVVAAALARPGSVGAHHRLDDPALVVPPEAWSACPEPMPLEDTGSVPAGRPVLEPASASAP
ncbi:L-aspartate oxidase [Brachybacterium hainanense]|uniref:L-aspartate oxidase n=1 Tax=Brachybacterium hainanense TaxID=1541174 RepID=A0ABV6RG60_9MICO